MIGQPGRFLPTARGFPQQLGWTDADCVRSALGIEADRPAVQAPLARADQALSVGVKQHGLAATGLELGQFAARVGLPETDAIPAAGRYQPAVGTESAAGSPRWRPAPRSGCRASPGGASGTLGLRPRPRRRSSRQYGRPAGGRPARSPGAHPARSPGAPPRPRPIAESCRSSLLVASR